MLADIDELHRGPATFNRMISSTVIDGLVFLTAGTEADEVVLRAASAALPTVMVNDRAPGLHSVDGRDPFEDVDFDHVLV